MHKEVRSFIKEVQRKCPGHFQHTKVLEVGSLDINGSVRKYFYKCNYTGLDLSEGKGVDVVCHGSIYMRPESFHVVISCEALEHDEQWQLTLRQMYINLMKGGLLLITCASVNRLEHGTHESAPECSPNTLGYYKNISAEEFQGVLPMTLFSNHLLEQRSGDKDLVFYGIKK